MTSLKPSEYVLRSAAPEDLPFVLDLHHRTLREYTDARDNKKPVRLEVLKTNIPAQQRYLRLGFRVYETTETHLKMEYIA